MHIYMLKDADTNEYFIRKGGGWTHDVNKASIWTNIRGPISAKSHIEKRYWKHVLPAPSLVIMTQKINVDHFKKWEKHELS